MKTLLFPLAAATAALALAAPAQAQSIDELDCVQRAAPEGLGHALVDDFMRVQGLLEGEREDVRTPLVAIVQGCSAENGIAASLRGPYTVYAAGRLAAIEARRRLEGMGVDMALVDSTLGLEWGAAAPQPDDWTPEQIDIITGEVARAAATQQGEGEYLTGVLIGFLIAMHVGSADAIDTIHR